MNNNDQQFMAQKIRTQYVEKQASEVDELKKLDAKVKRPANVFAYVFGSVGAVVMGGGMSLVMTDFAQTLGIENAMVIGVAVGLVGLLMAAINYPIYKGILACRKRKFADKILSLSDQILNKE